jgi:hypothetical protein
MATKCFTDCQNPGCGIKRIKHTDYYYHSKGSVEIKYMEDNQTG